MTDLDTSYDQAPSAPLYAGQADYFGFSGTSRYMFPDGVSYADLKVLNEGERRAYLNETNREVRFAKGGDAAMRMRPGDDRAALLRKAIIGWNLLRNDQPVPFTRQNLDQFLNLADPRLIDDIEKEVRKANPWLLADMEIEDIQKEIDALEEMKARKLEEAEGKND